MEKSEKVALKLEKGTPFLKLFYIPHQLNREVLTTDGCWSVMKEWKTIVIFLFLIDAEQKPHISTIPALCGC